MTRRFVIERLARSHDRKSFACGAAPLDRYLKELAGQDIRRRVANCFVAVEQATQRLAGYYTLSAAGVSVAELPAGTVRRLPPYATIPAALIGRLAVDVHFQGIRLGEALLLDAADRVLDADPAVFALLVDAKDDAALSFYARYEFRPLRTRPMTLFLPVASLDARRRKDTKP